MSNNTSNGNSPISPDHFQGLEPRMMLAGDPSGAADSALAYDAKGNLHVAYYDANTKDLKYAVQYKNGSWSKAVTVDDSSKNVGTQVSIALDKDNRPAIAYRDEIKQDLKFARFDGKKWTVSTVDAKNNTGVNPSLAFDKQNNPLISYYSPSTKDLYLASGSVKGWTFTTIANNASAGPNSSIAVDPKTGKAAVAYEGKDGKVRYAEKNGNSFGAPTVVETTSKGGGEISLTFAGSKPAFSYFDPQTGEIKLATQTKNGFTVTPVATVDGSADPGAKVVIDPATNKPVVVFYDAANDGIYVATKGGEVTLVAEGGSSNTPIVIDPKTGKIIFTQPSEDGGTPDVVDTRKNPAAPSDVTAEAVSDSEIEVSWSDNSDNEAGFLIERTTDEDSGVWVTVATVDANVTSFTDTGLDEGTAYVYRVTAFGPTGATAVAAEFGDASTLPAAPSGVAVTPVSHNVIQVDWSDNTDAEESYLVERSTDGGATFVQVAVRPAGSENYTDNTVSEGTTYVYRITALSDAGNSAAVSSPATTVVAAPSALVAVSVSAGQVNLAWTNNSNKATGVVIERSSDGGDTFAQIASISGNATAFVDSTVTAGAEYVYRIKAVSSAGPSTYATSTATRVIPDAPTGLSATAVATTQVDLAWTEVSGATSYVVERSSDGGDTFADLATVTLPAYSDTSALEASSYVYRVRAVNSAGDSVASSEANATTFLAAPSNLVATADSVSQITLTWTDNSDGETGFLIERSTDGGTTWAQVDMMSPNSGLWFDASASEGTSYSYRVRGFKGDVYSDYTLVAAATTHMHAPSVLSATAVSLTQIDLAWSNSSSAETGYEIFRSTDGGTTWALLHTAAADATAYSDASVTEGKTYQYKVRAINAVAASDHTAAQSATTKPAAPTSLAGTVVSSTQIDLTWVDNSAGETGYRVEVSTDGGTTWSTLDTLAAGSDSYSHTTATEGASYQYRVLAANGAGDSAASNVVTAVSRPAAPSDLAATSTNATTVHLTWTDNSNTESGFIVERSSDGGATFAAVSGLLGADSASFDDTTASAGTSYVYRVLAVNSAAATSASGTDSVLTLPAAATGVAAVANGPTSVDLAWNAVTGASSYVVERTADGGTSWTVLDNAVATNNFTDSTATEGGTYAYRVTAVNATGSGDVSADSAPVTTVPVAATGLAATPVSATRVDLAWTDNSNAETGYKVQRSTDGGTTWTTLTTLAADSNSYSDLTATAAATFHYRVIAAGAGGDSAASNADDVLTVPAAPASVSAIATADTRATVSWSAVTGAAGYTIERSADAGSTWTPVTSVGSGTLAHADTTASEGTAYVYRVYATNATGSSAASSNATVTTLPAAATNLTATLVSPTQVDLTWDDNSGGETGYLVERSSNGGVNFTPLIVVGAGVTTYSDTAAVEATSYIYRVKPVNITGTGAGITASAITAPVAPTALGLTAVSATQIDLAWTDNSSRETGYVIERSLDGATWATVHTAAADATSWSDTTVAGGTAYHYRVRATGAGTDSANSNAPSALTAPAAVSDLALTVISATQINLTWTDVNGETGYTLERSDDGGSTWSTIATPAAGDTSYNDTTVAEGITYTYRLTSANGTGASADSNAPSATTLPAAASGLNATPVSATQIDLAWSDNSANETAFVIERSDDGGATWSVVHTTADNATTWSDTTVVAGTAYSYRVIAKQGAAVAPASNTDAATTLPAGTASVTASVVSDTQVDLTWDAVTGADDYLVEVSDDGGSTWSTVGTVAGTSTSHNTATEGTDYLYRVTANNASGSSAPTSSNAVTTLAAAVTGVAVTEVDAGQLDIAWNDTSSGETGFRIERSDDGGTSWSTVHTAAANATTWSDTTVSAGSTYHYRVFALTASGDSAVSNVDSALTHPGQVTDLTATPMSATQVDLAWTPVDSATNYLIEASTDNGNNWSTVTTVGNVATYSHTATESTAYLYRVTAINATGNGVASADEAATTFSAAPSSLIVTPMTATSIDLTWTDNSSGETGFLIERSHDGGVSWYTVQTNPAGDNTWTDSTVTGGSTFQYRVIAQNATGDSPAATAAAVTTVPDAATVTATTVSTTAIDLAWVAPTGATGYELEFSTDGGSTWSPLATINDPTTVIYNHTGLTEGTEYTYRVTAFNATGNAAASTDVASTISAGATGLSVTATSNANIDLTWTDNSAGETGYRIERSTDGGTSWSTVHTTAANASSWSDTTVSGGTTYHYRVIAEGDAGDAAASNTDDALTNPDQVTGVIATHGSATSVTVSWSAVTGATSYTVRRSTDGGTSWTNIGSTASLSYEDTGRTEATTYTYDVIATNATGDGADSANDDALTLPAAPSGLTATGQNTTTIDLSWTDNSAGEASYVIERSDDGGATWSTVHTTAANATSWSDTTATEGTAYKYRVHATNASGDSDLSSVADGNSAPAAVSGVTATAVSATQVDVTWTDNSAGESGFIIERSIDGGSTWTLAGNAAAGETSYSDTAAPEGTALEYRVRAVKGSIESANAPTDSVTTVSAAASSLTATASAPTTVDLTWADNSASETGYEIYRSTDGGTSWTLVHSAAANATSWSDAAAPENAALKYKVVATGAGGDSADSNVADATTPIAAPTTLTATASSDTTIDLAWTDNSTAETGFKIERSDDGGTTWTLVHTTAADATSWSDTTRDEDTTYTYRVTATDGSVDSVASNTDDAKTALTAPAITAVSSPTATSVSLTWSDNSGAETGYQIERSDDGGSTWSLVHTTAADVTTWTDTGLSEGTQYQYRVRAQGNGGNFSDYTAVSTLTTIPATPTTVTATPFSTTQIDLTWADNSANESGYVIERSSDGGATWTDIHTTAQDATSWSDASVTEASDYQYRVRAVGVGGDSADSNTASATSIPNAPTTLTSSVVSATQVDLAWVDNSNGEANYVIERSTDNGVSFSALTTVAAGSTSYSDTSANEATAYVYRVRAVRNGVNSDWSNSSLQVTTLPAAATDLAVSTPTNTRAVLTWTDNSSGETGFKVYRSADAGSTWTLINTTIANVETYSDNTVTEGGSYSYRVVAFNATGDGVTTAPVSVTTVPAAPTGLSGSAANPNRIDLSWTDRSGAETGYKVERSTNGGGTWAEIADLPANSNSYSDSSVAEGTNYQYKVRAYGPGGNSGYTASVSVTTQLLAPTALTATTVSATQVNLAWTDNSTKESQYKVERSADGGSTWSVITTLAANATSYSDTTAVEGTAYLYKIRAARTGNTSAYTANAAATTLPAAPSGLNATVASATQVNLAWTDNSAGETGFVVERSSDGGATWTQIATPAANASSYNDTTATEGTAYTYRVKAVNAGGSSAFATSSSVTTLPAAPTSLVATSPLADTVELTWTDNSANETGFKVERSDDGGSTWTQIATTLAGVTTYADTTVEEGTEYQYRVRANLGGANSAYSNTQSVTTVPLIPTDLVATTVSQTQVDLAWTDTSGGEAGFKIERSEDGGITWSEIHTTAADATSYSDTTVTEGLYYQYRIRATNAGGDSGYSSSAEALTLPAAPSSLDAEAVAADEVLVTWTDNSVGEEGFYLERETADNPGVWVLIATLTPDANSYSDATVVSGQTYTYRVRAFNTAGESANSATDSTTTP